MRSNFLSFKIQSLQRSSFLFEVMSSGILFRTFQHSCGNYHRHPSLSLSWSRSIGTFTRFQDYLISRRSQAKKSLLIQVTNPENAHEVGRYLRSNFGPIDNLYHYAISKKTRSSSGSGSTTSYSSAAASIGGGGDGSHWLLAEFPSQEGLTQCLKSCNHPHGSVPCSLSMIWHRPHNGNQSQRKGLKSKGSASTSSEDLKTENLDGQVNEKNYLGKSLNDQLKVLEDSTKLTELGIRLRFFLASQLEQSFQTFFPSGCVLPFGSTVSGIGRQSGDLDLVLVPDSREIFPDFYKSPEGDGNGLYFHSKLPSASNSSNARFQAQRIMETMADVIHLFVPGCNHVQRILQARIPILRFCSEFTDLQCDLSMTNSSGVHMSELIYLMSKIEPRFSTLLFAIRSWAAARKITNPVPGKQPTNFMLVLLLIYFLQRKQLLPTLDILFNNADAGDQRTTIDGIDCSFLRDKDKILKHFTPHLNGEETVAELLFDFFEFYSEFDFNQKGVSLITGSSWGKPDTGPLYIQNPLERHLNVSRNVSKEEVTRFKSECCSALWRLETSWDSLNSPKGGGKTGEVSLKDVLLSPTLDNRPPKENELRLRMKELFTK